MEEIPVGMQVKTICDVTIGEPGSSAATFIPINSEGVVPDAESILKLFDASRTCPVIMEIDELRIPTIVFLPWEVIEPIP